MSISKLSRYAMKELLRYKNRSITSILGYGLAVGAMLTILSIAQPFINEIVDELKGVGTHFGAYKPLVLKDKMYSHDSGAFVEEVFTYMMDKSIIDEVKKIPGVRFAAPYLLYKKYHFDYNRFISIGGIDSENYATWKSVCAPTNVRDGRFLNPNDIDKVIVEESFAKSGAYKLGETIKAFGKNLEIVGIVNTGIRQGKANMYAPLFTVQEIVKNDPACECEDKTRENKDLNIVLVEVADSRKQIEVFKSVQKVVGDKSTLSSYNCYEPAAAVIGMTNRIAFIVTLFIIFFSTLYAAKSQLASVVERKRHIGILKVLGWTNKSVMTQIILESLFQSFLGGIVGLIIAITMNLIFHGNIQSLSIGLFLSGMAIAIVTGIIASIFPARQSYKLMPAEALRRL